MRLRNDGTGTKGASQQADAAGIGRLAPFLTLVAVAVGVRAGLLGVGYDTLSDASRIVPLTDYFVLTLHVVGTIALLGVIWARHRVALGVGAAFLLYSTITVTLAGQSTSGLVVFWISSGVAFAGLIAAWLRPERPLALVRLIIDAAIGLVAGVVTFLAMV